MLSLAYVPTFARHHASSRSRVRTFSRSRVIVNTRSRAHVNAPRHATPLDISPRTWYSRPRALVVLRPSSAHENHYQFARVACILIRFHVSS